MTNAMYTVFHHCWKDIFPLMGFDHSKEPKGYLDPAEAIVEYGAFIERIVVGLSRKYYGILCALDLDDIRQDVNIKILEGALRSYRGESSMEGFLYRIVYNVTMDHLRRVDPRRNKTEDFDERAPMVSTRDSHERDIEVQEALDFIKDEASKLPEKQRLVFIMIAIDGMTQEEAARALNLRQSTVSEHYAKAKKLITAKAKKLYPDMEFA